MAVIANPSRAERALVLLGAVGLVAFVALWALLPEPPPTKGLDPAPPLEAFVALAAGAMLVIGTVRSVVSGWRTRGWPLTPGQVVESRSLGGPYLYTLCRYTVNGTEHHLDAVQYGRPGLLRPREGDSIVVRYDPVDTTRAVVHPSPSPMAVSMLALGVVALGLGTVSAWTP